MIPLVRASLLRSQKEWSVSRMHGGDPILEE
mgnify:FL=1